MQGGEEARSETYLDVRCNDERRSQRRRWAFFSSLLGCEAVVESIRDWRRAQAIRPSVSAVIW
ncbi:MAG TPA: hypothetical protein VJO34_01540, partial [Methylomirabilota bacterium]|nr:hypothetical protein [Methylomirabilota bacterium]